MPARLTRIMRLAEKKYMINSRGFFKRKEPISVSIPNTRKKIAKRAIKIFFPHQKHEPMNFNLLKIVMTFLRSYACVNLSVSRSIVKRLRIRIHGDFPSMREKVKVFPRYCRKR
jgi:hypothetical protein